MKIYQMRIDRIILGSLIFSLLCIENAFGATAADFKSVPPFLTNQEPPLVMLVMDRNHKLYYEAYNDASDLNEDGGLDVGYKGEDEKYTDSNGNGKWDTGEPLTDINKDEKWNKAIDYYGYFDSYKCYVYDSSDARFEPSSAPKDANNKKMKKCSGASEWSGDFLNYLTMSRMDTMRKVLYGGYRSTDNAQPNNKYDDDEGYTDSNGDHQYNFEEPYTDSNGNGIYDAGDPYTDSNSNGSHDAAEPFTDGGDANNLTVLERVFIPQDAHSWGKEYQSVEADGYDISEYTPLALPNAGTRHLFASTTIEQDKETVLPPGVTSDGNNDGSDDPPLLRVLPNNHHRIWEWVAVERPVAHNDSRIVEAATPPSMYSEFIETQAEFDTVLANFATVGHLQGTWEVSKIDQSGTNINPSMTNPDNDYLSVFTAHIDVLDGAAGGYTNEFDFGVNGDDAVEVVIHGVTDPGNPLVDANNDFIVSWLGGHGMGSIDAHHGQVTLAPGSYRIEYRFHERGGDEGWVLKVKRQKANLTWTGWNDVEYDADAPDKYTKILHEANWIQNFYNLVISAGSASTITDYEVRVVVCDPAMPEDNCRQYPDGNFKPVGLLQRYGEDERMMFGLLSGSYRNNTVGGVLRKNIGSIRDEIKLYNGKFKSLPVDADGVPTSGGIVDTINKFRTYDYSYGDYSYQNCGWITNRAVNETGECVMWGNPIGEMMYEGLRYFAGKATPTASFTYTGTTIDRNLKLPLPEWMDPYKVEDTNRDGVLDGEDTNKNNILDAGEDVNNNGVLDYGEDLNHNGKLDGFENCAKPFMLVLSDIYPTFDSNQVPGSYFATFADGLSHSPNPAVNVSALAKTISTGEGIFPDNFFIGTSATSYDGACSAKPVADLSELKGLCPEDPTKLGSYYSAAIAYYGNWYDISPTAEGKQNVTTMAVGLASPLPEIKINVGGSMVNLVPFAKSTGGSGITTTMPPAGFQPTNTIVDFFVEEITETHGVFRINFEDVEQGADHDQDFITRYEYQVVGNTLTITLTSVTAAGGIEQHAGYIISGTTADGVYLEVRDNDTTEANDDDYFLDTPYDPTKPVADRCTAPNTPANCWDDDAALPLSHSRVFSPGTAPAATLLKDPLRYAAKWGGFVDTNTPTEDVNNNKVLDAGEDLNGNNVIDFTATPTPDLAEEWDEDGNGVSDNYFFVVNPLRLEEQLTASFAAILRRAASGTAASVISNSRSGEGAVYQSLFYPELEINSKTITWLGEVHALFTDAHGNMREDTNGNKQLNIHNEDLNGNGDLDHKLSEDANGDFILDTGEDLNHNGRLDYNLDEDVNKDGDLDTRDLIIQFDGSNIYKIDDINENEAVDNEDQIVFVPDIPSWHNNGVLNTEDTNGNGRLDTDLGEDINHNGELDYEDQDKNKALSIDPRTGPFSLVTSNPAEKVKFIWSAADWLNSGSLDLAGTPRTLDPLTQRTYTQAEDKRYIFTFVDSDNDGIVDANEQVPFLNSTDPVPVADLTDTSKFYSYLTLYPTFTDKPAWVTSIGAVKKSEYEQGEAKRLVEYIRGQDSTASLIVNGVKAPDMRSRTYFDSVEGKYKTWRLGDIVHSSPTVVGRPQEAYHLLYRDRSYADFIARHQDRRSVVYTGANDGMIHAFNAGFYDADTATFLTNIGEPFTDLNGDGNYDDGSEGAAGNWTDNDGDGTFDGNINETYTDTDGDGHYDKKEDFTDTDGDGHRDEGEAFTDGSNGRPVDGVFNPGDSYTDTDKDCHYDATEPYSDLDFDGHWDDEEEPYTDAMNGHRDPSGEAYVDGSNGFPHDGHYQNGETFNDHYNDTYDVGEEYVDGSNSNPVDGHYNAGEDFTDTNGNFIWDGAEPFVDGSNGFPSDLAYNVGEDYTDTNGNSVWDAAEPFVDGSNGYPADSAYNIGETFTDTDGDKVRDVAEAYFDLDHDGHHDPAEPYFDTDGDHKRDTGEIYTDDIDDDMYTSPEDFADTDGDCRYDSAEPFVDADNDTRYDAGEPFVDYNDNNRYDGVEEFDDLNLDGNYDPGEPFVDLDGDGHFDEPDTFTDLDSDGHFDPVHETYVDKNNNGEYDEATQTPYALGSELWAYIPYNLLPHLYWLTETGYPHVYFNDLQPKIFDAKVFFKSDGEALDADADNPDGINYPHGWGTVMVVGMRFGGGSIVADIDRDDVDESDPAIGTDRTMTSGYVVFDITNPEAEPRVLAEITLDKQGYATCFPSVIPMRPRLIGKKTAAQWDVGLNDWYLAFGSGPADSNGVAASHDSLELILDEGISKQPGKFFVLDLKKLISQAAGPVISTINESGAATTAAPYFIQQLEANSFVSQPITVDYNLDFKADTVYFGTISGSETTGWAGRMRRLLVLNDPADASTGNVAWTGFYHGVDRADNTMIDLSPIYSGVTEILNGQPVSAAASVTVGNRVFDNAGVVFDVNEDGFKNDYDRERWVFFGTGRFYVTEDSKNIDQQSYYGIKEPIENGIFSWKPVTRAALLDVTDIETFDETEVAGNRIARVESANHTDITDWDELLEEIDSHQGWYQDFDEVRERNLGQAVLLGELLTFTTYIPAMDPCTPEGESRLSALYYRTGTAYFEPALGFVWDDDGDNIFEEGERRMIKEVNLGRGLALSPNVHTGKEEGSRAYIQTSTGAIETVDQINPGMTKSGKNSWLLR